MNIMKVAEMKKPLKSYDLRGFDLICIAYGGE